MASFFCAYPSNPPIISQVMTSCSAALTKGGTSLFLWEENDVWGRPLTDPIFEQIEAADGLIADVTYFNFNVLFEIGYAVAREKPTLLVLNAGLKRDLGLFAEIGILQSIGYETYQNSAELAQKLSATVRGTPTTTAYPKNRKAPLYIVEFPTKTDFMTRLISRVKKTRIRYRAFNPEEHIRLSAQEAIENVSVSSGVIVPLASSHYRDADAHNLRAAFVSGLSIGMRIPTLLIQEHGGPVPLDVREFVREFKP
jgi:hypothetical protein